VGGSGTGGSSGGAAGCDAEVSRENRDLVGKALDELFVQKDVGAIDRYWADPYLQHNPIATSGVATFRSVMSSIVASSSFSYQRLRTLGECDLVVVQGRYSTSGVIFDMLRVANKKIVEHWDSDSNQASESAGSTAVVDGQPTAQNRARVLALIDAVLVSGQTARAADFIAANHVEHRGNGGTGPQAFLAYVNADDIRYSTVHHVIADNNFVFTLSEGELGGTAYGFYDLFRLDGGSVVEHWDSRRRVPSTTASGLPIF
jgi:predicted SnoaL-like aldol condensation-catalyzing enzyme